MKNLRQKILEIVTYHSKGGTSRYLLNNEQVNKILRLFEVDCGVPAGFYRQLFREMPEDRVFTARQLADMFERVAPFDPKGLIKEAVKKMLQVREML